MIILYNIAFLFFATLYLPFFLLKLRQEPNPKRLLTERFGIFPKLFREKMIGKKIIWIHAVSVGEVLVAQRLLPELLARLPQCHIVLSTVTPTGQRVAQKKQDARVTVCYFPFDWTPCVRNFYKVIGPECLVLVETEIWPNLLLEAQRKKVPVVIINARLSEKSAKRYIQFGSFFRKLFTALDLVCVQSEEDGRRFEKAGTDPKRIQVLGNMKFDNPDLENIKPESVPRLREQWKLKPHDLLWIAGSTHRGEEKQLLPVFSILRQTYPSLKLLIAPRHIERSSQIKRIFSFAGWKVALSNEDFKSDFDVLILNQLGVLKKLYQMADVVFMGGSLVKRGGQNPIEAAVFKRAILHGPYVMNFEAVYRTMDREGAALPIRDAEQLRYAMSRLLANRTECAILGQNAYEVVQRLKGATERYVDTLTHFFEPSNFVGKEITCEIP